MNLTICQHQELVYNIFPHPQVWMKTLVSCCWLTCVMVSHPVYSTRVLWSMHAVRLFFFVQRMPCYLCVEHRISGVMISPLLPCLHTSLSTKSNCHPMRRKLVSRKVGHGDLGHHSHRTLSPSYWFEFCVRLLKFGLKELVSRDLPW